MNALMFVCGAVLCGGSFYALRRTKDVIDTRFLRTVAACTVLGTIGGMGSIFAVLPHKTAQSDQPPLTLAELHDARKEARP